MQVKLIHAPRWCEDGLSTLNDPTSVASLQSNERLILVMFVVLALVWILFVFGFLILFFKPWIQAVLSGSPISIFALFGMRLRGSPAKMLIQAYTMLRMRGLDVKIADVERTYIAIRARVQCAGSRQSCREPAAPGGPARAIALGSAGAIVWPGVQETIT